MTDGDDDPKPEAAYTERDGNVEHHYDSNWNLIGHTEIAGDGEHHYDPSWNLTGHTEHDQDGEHHYDPSWNLAGHTERDGDRDRHYDPSWNLTGYSERDGNVARHYDPSWNLGGSRTSGRGGGAASGSGTWVGGNSSNSSLGVGALIILLIIVGIPAGWFIQRQKRLAYIAELPTVRMSLGVGGPDAEENGVIRYVHGRPQTLRIWVNWEPQSVYWSERPIRITISQNGNVRYNRIWKHEDLQFNGIAFDISDKFPKGLYLLEVAVEGAPLARRNFVVEPRPPGSINISDTPPGWPRQNMTVLRPYPGQTKKIFTYVRINGTIPPEGRTVYISLMHEGTALFNYSNHITERNRDFYIPYEANFAEGSYTARLSASDEPAAQYAFSVQYPPVHTAQEKAQRTSQMIDRILLGSQQQAPPESGRTTTIRENARPADMARPTSAAQTQDCYDGAWRENVPNQFVWNFRRYGDTLRITRNDQFVKGEFRRTQEGWAGFLSWGNGTIWKGVVLHEANNACNEITTNQRWWYKR